MRSDDELISMYREGKQHELTDDERNRLHNLPEFQEEKEASENQDAMPQDVVFKSDKEIAAARESEKASHVWPDSVLHPQGLVGDVNDWILTSSPMPQPKFALAAALTVCGALLGRGVKDYTGQRTNIFTLCLTASSGGKQHPFSCCRKLFWALGRGDSLFGEVASDSGLEYSLQANPSRLMMLDEVGDYIGGMKGAGRTNPYLAAVVPRLKILWSSAGETYIGKTRSVDSNGKWHKPVTIVRPHIAIYGTGAPSRLCENLTERDCDDGTLPRFIVFISEEQPMREEKEEVVVPDTLKSQLADALNTLGLTTPAQSSDGGDSSASSADNARRIPESPGAKEVFREFEIFRHERMMLTTDDALCYLWGKCVENARRVALTVACLRTPENPCVENADAEFAVGLMKYSISETITCLRGNVALTPRQKHLKDLERHIRLAGKNGIEQSELTRKTQGMDVNYRRSMLDELKEAGTIRLCEREGQGKKKVHMYYHSTFVE